MMASSLDETEVAAYIHEQGYHRNDLSTTVRLS